MDFKEFAHVASGEEPGLLFRSPEPKNHDYNPAWDYEVDDEPDSELAQFATEVAKRIYAHTQQPFELWACHLTCAAMYVDGTATYPVVLIDLDAHREYQDQIGKSINHELKHAVQDAEGRDYDEDEAEEDD